MNLEKIVFQSIGRIRTPHRVLADIPIQSSLAKGIEGTVVLDPAFEGGLKDIEAFSHIILFYLFHQSHKTRLRLKPYVSDQAHGIFATRAPHRPNKLGMSLVRLMRIDGHVLHVSDLDILDGTPLIDIKPYIKRFDSRTSVRSGWHDAVSDDVLTDRGMRNYKG